MDGLPASEPLRRTSLGDYVYDSLLDRLITRRIPPGARINIDEMTRELRVSQTPIRAALVRLEAEGLVLKTHNVGFSAAALPSLRRLLEIGQLRILLEPYAAERAAERMTPQAAQDLTEIARQIEEPATTDRRVSYSQTARLDAAFHERIFRIGGCDLISETFARLHVHTHFFRVMHQIPAREAAVAEHRRLLAALVAGDPAASRQAMEDHVTQATARMATLADELD